MANTKRYTINTKISEKEYAELSLMAERENISIGALLKLFVGAIVNGDIMVEKGELKTCPTTDEHCVSEVSEDEFQENLRYKSLRFDRLIAAFEKRGYPDEEIRRSVETIIQTVLDAPKYNPRRSRYDESC